ncbi:MAG: GntR family transcriptional regulator [Rhodobacteraceae bacterium]|nr:GntR family transcriptional regulator [Paracoccaceae bacterium]
MLDNTRGKRVDRVFLRLKEEIRNSELPPGFQAPEPEIAERVGMSRTPVREALIRLEAAGMVSLVPRHGAKVLPLQRGDLVEIFDLLMALEQVAVSDVQFGELSDAEKQDLLDAAGEADKALHFGDADEWIVADELFHRLLGELRGFGRLGQWIGVLLDQVHRGRRILCRIPERPALGENGYTLLATASLNGDTELAQELSSRNLILIKDHLLEGFDRAGVDAV